MNITNERAQAIAEAAIAYEAAKDKATTMRIAHDKLRRWKGGTYEYSGSEEEWKKSQWALETAQLDRNCKRRAYQRQLRSALLEAAQ